MKNTGFTHQKVAILIDSSNIFRIAKNRGARVNYERLLERLNHRQIIRALVFKAERDPENESGFLRKVRSFGFEVRTKKLRIYPNGKMKGDMDMELAMEAVTLAGKVDVVVLVTGDGDFVALVHYLKSRGVKVEAMAFHGTGTSRNLREAVDEFIPITEDLLFCLVSHTPDDAA